MTLKIEINFQSKIMVCHGILKRLKSGNPEKNVVLCEMNSLVSFQQGTLPNITATANSSFGLNACKIRVYQRHLRWKSKRIFLVYNEGRNMNLPFEDSSRKGVKSDEFLLVSR